MNIPNTIPEPSGEQKVYVFKQGDNEFMCKAFTQEEANSYFDGAYIYDGKRRVKSQDVDVVCEIKETESDLQAAA
jgi:hypothetical protein